MGVICTIIQTVFIVLVVVGIGWFFFTFAAKWLRGVYLGWLQFIFCFSGETDADDRKLRYYLARKFVRSGQGAGLGFKEMVTSMVHWMVIYAILIGLFALLLLFCD
ncbi:MAG: hypothetical protein EA425_07745 [Puniceicoccaceae bacterium]|nr:MAG: hypothetical protein EA425_07745 [Puniceicoccaceae bacterium]